MKDTDELSKYRVWMHSAPGMWERYSGYVDVWATDSEQAQTKARARLKRESFSDRPSWAWVVDRIEVTA